MVFDRFEDIIAWWKSQEFAVKLYTLFEDSKDWDFKKQICRAAVSISNNIAEGFGRGSNADFHRFLYIAMGSASEVKSMLYLCRKLGYISEDEEIQLLKEISEIIMVIRGLIKSVKLNINFKK